MTVSTDCLWYQKPVADVELKEWFNTVASEAPKSLPVFLDGVAKNNDAQAEFCGGTAPWTD